MRSRSPFENYSQMAIAIVALRSSYSMYSCKIFIFFQHNFPSFVFYSHDTSCPNPKMYLEILRADEWLNSFKKYIIQQQIADALQKVCTVTNCLHLRSTGLRIALYSKRFELCLPWVTGCWNCNALQRRIKINWNIFCWTFWDFYI